MASAVSENPDGVKVFAPAKINLFLHVGEMRGDGYHALQSLVAFAETGDEIRAQRSDDFSLVMDGPFAGALVDEKDNLVLRAARLLAAEACVATGARLTLTKNLPVASGIGGGSADAAACLRALWQFWGLEDAPQVTRATLEQAAIETGSDVPVCLLSGAALMEGRGEVVTALPELPRAAMVLVNPRVAVPTGPVFARLRARSGADGVAAPSGFADVKALVDFLAQARNDLQAPALEIAPVIQDVLTALGAEGALLTRMCGSGATCYALFADDAAAARAAQSVQQRNPGWWVCATRIASNSIGAPRSF